jgi:hypothetical protein
MTSSCGRGPKLSLRKRADSGMSRRPIGTLIQKIHPQSSPSTTTPPITGPAATARPANAPSESPMAKPRCSAGNASLISVSVSGNTIAAPAPCAARAAISAPTDGEIGAATDATVKMDTPTLNMRRRPKRSPSAAPVRSKQANARL